MAVLRLSSFSFGVWSQRIHVLRQGCTGRKDRFYLSLFTLLAKNMIENALQIGHRADRVCFACEKGAQRILTDLGERIEMMEKRYEQ